MKERLLQALKIILIIFGILFLIQIIIFGLMMIGIFSFASLKPVDFNFDFDKVQSNTKPKEMLPIVKYVEDYYSTNNKYPEKIENVKVPQKLDYTYEVTKDGNCYTLTIKNKAKTKQYQHCKTLSDNSSSTSESYVEYSK